MYFLFKGANMKMVTVKTIRTRFVFDEKSCFHLKNVGQSEYIRDMSEDEYEKLEENCPVWEGDVHIEHVLLN